MIDDLTMCAAVLALGFVTVAAITGRRRPAPIAVTDPPRHVRIIRPPYDQDAEA